MSTPLEHPPGPRNLLRWCGLTVRHLLMLWRRPTEFVASVAKRYGDLSSFLVLRRRIYIVNHPDLIHDVLIRQRENYGKAEWILQILRQVVGDGLLASSGQKWLRQRRLIQQVFRHNTMERYAQIAVSHTEGYINKWPDTNTLDLAGVMSSLTMEISIQSTLGIAAEANAPQLARAIQRGADILNSEMENPLRAPEWLPLPSKFEKRRVVKSIDQYVWKAIEQTRKNPDADPHCLLALLLAVVDEEGDGQGMPQPLVRDEAVTAMVAGNHSTSATLSWIWCLLMNHDAIYQRVVGEVREVVGGGRPTLSDMERLPYTGQVIQESLRLFPSAWVLFCREALHETQLGGYRIEKGGYLFIYPWVTHRDARFFPEPLKFDPERFSPERIDDIPKNAYIPFGLGPHACIGSRLAITQITMILATILSRCSVRPDGQAPSLEISRDMAIRPRHGCRVILEKRNKQPPAPDSPSLSRPARIPTG